MQELNFENLGKAFEGGIYLSIFLCALYLKQSLNDITEKPKIQGSLSSLYDQPKRCIVIVKGKSPKNYHRFAACLVPRRWVSFNYPRKIPQPPGRDEGTWENCHGRLEERIARGANCECECRMLPVAPSNTKGSIRDFCYVFVCC